MKIIGVTKIYSHFSPCKPTKQTIINHKQPPVVKNTTFHHKNRQQEQKKNKRPTNCRTLIFSYFVSLLLGLMLRAQQIEYNLDG